MRGRLTAEAHSYLIALGSNIHVPGVGPPREVVAAAIATLEAEGLGIQATSPIIDTAPLGPSRRRYANAAAVIDSSADPEEVLAILQRVERAFGRRRRGMRWQARPLDLDIVLWSDGIWASDNLLIPHPSFREREFVLGPAAAIAPDWRDPLTGRSIRQLYARLTRARPLPR